MQQFKYEYNTIGQFYDYITKSPLNSIFQWSKLASTREGRYNFTKTNSFEEATELLRNGWDDMAQKLNNKLVAACKVAPVMQRKQVLGVAGYQPIVALYLAGVPTNMVNTQMVPVKSKILNITKSINYCGATDADVIIEESIKAMQVVKRLEAQGYRVNLNIALGTEADYRQILCKVCLKHANEKLNVSKLAFAMVHPSMLRRLFFRFVEVCPDTTQGYRVGYGRPVEFEDMQKAFPKDIVLPAVWNVNPDKIDSLDKLEASF